MKKLDRELLARTVTDTVLEDIAQGKVGGAAILVMQQGETVFDGCFYEPDSPFAVKPDTVFRLASMTKPVTAAAVLKLVERGLLNLDDPVGDWASRNRTEEQKRDLAAVAKYYSGIGLDFVPLSAQAYSGVFAFDVAARIVEVITGMPYDRFLQQEIFELLGMVDTTFAPTQEQWDRMIPMHDRKNEKSVVKQTVLGTIFEGFPTTYFAGGAGLASTLRDYARFAQMMQNGGSLEGVQILKPESVRQMATPQLPETLMPGNEIWGLGVRVITRDNYGPLPVGTFGWSGAYGTHFWVDPVNQITAVYLKNSAYDGGSGARTSRQFEEDVYHSLIS